MVAAWRYEAAAFALHAVILVSSIALFTLLDPVKRLVVGLVHYVVASEQKPGISSSTPLRSDIRTTKPSKGKEKEKSPRTRREALNLGESGKLLAIPLDLRSAHGPHVNPYLSNALVYSGATLLAALVDVTLHAWFPQLPISALTPIFALTAIYSSFRALLAAELFDRLCSRFNRGLIITLSLVGCLASLVGLAVVPETLVQHGRDDALRALRHVNLWALLLPSEAKMTRVAAAYHVQIPSHILHLTRTLTRVDPRTVATTTTTTTTAAGYLVLLGSGLVAALVVASMSTAVLRFMRSLHLVSRPPDWAAPQVQVPPHVVGLLHTALVAPLLIPLVVFTPLEIQATVRAAVTSCSFVPAGVADALAQHLLPAALVVVGTLHLACARTALQAYLHTALLAWRRTTHEVLRPEDTSGSVVKRVRDVNQVNENFPCSPPTGVPTPGRRHP